MLVKILIKKNKLSALFPLETLICIHFQGSRPESTKKMKNVSNILIKKNNTLSPTYTYMSLFQRSTPEFTKKRRKEIVIFSFKEKTRTTPPKPQTCHHYK